MNARFTARARQVMQLADHEARRFGHEYIGTEHLLLAVLRGGGGVGSDVLRVLGVDLGRVDREVCAVVQSAPDVAPCGRLPQTPRARKVVEMAIEEAGLLGHAMVGTGHLVLALVREEEGVAAQVLLALGVKWRGSTTDLRSRVSAEQARLDDDSPERPPFDTTAPPEYPRPRPDPGERMSLLPARRKDVGRPLRPAVYSIVRLVLGSLLASGGISGFFFLSGPVLVPFALAIAVGLHLVAGEFRPRAPVLANVEGIARAHLLRLIEAEMTTKFGAIDQKRREEIRRWDEGRLAEARRRLPDARSLDDLM